MAISGVGDFSRLVRLLLSLYVFYLFGEFTASVWLQDVENTVVETNLDFLGEVNSLAVEWSVERLCKKE